MNVVYESSLQHTVKLRDANPGDCVQFLRQVNQEHAPDALFLVMNVPSQYMSESVRHVRSEYYKIMVANIDTGFASLVLASRLVRVVKVKVAVFDDE